MVIWQGIECQVDNCPHHLEDTVLLLFHLLFLLKNLVSVLELLPLHSRSHYALVPLSTTESRQRELSFTSRACNLSDSLRIRAWIILETSQPLFLFQMHIYMYFFLLPKKIFPQDIMTLNHKYFMIAYDFVLPDSYKALCKVMFLFHAA